MGCCFSKAQVAEDVPAPHREASSRREGEPPRKPASKRLSSEAGSRRAHESPKAPESPRTSGSSRAGTSPRTGGTPRSGISVIGKDRYSAAELLQLAKEALQRHSKVLKVDAIMLAAVALVESSGDPKAYRYESHLGEASTGLTQVLTSTARWLAKDLGFNAYGIPNEDELYDPETSMYFGAAYLTWLSTYKGKKQSEEFVVRGFNGGPNGIRLKATQRYWEKYQKAKKELLEIQRMPPGKSRESTPPPGDDGVVHIVKSGDTLWAISRQYGVTVESIIALNPSIVPDSLSIGQVVRIS